VAHVLQEIAKVKELMQLDDISALAEQQPAFLDSDGVSDALLEIKRLMPTGTDASAMLRRDPSFLLRVQRGQRYLGENPDADPESSYLEDRTTELAKLREQREQQRQEER
jgi:hypothetical protein